MAIAAFVISVVLFVMSAALILNAVVQVKTTGLYNPPDWFIDICKLVIGSGLVVLGIPALSKFKRGD